MKIYCPSCKRYYWGFGWEIVCPKGHGLPEPREDEDEDEPEQPEGTE